MFTFNSFKNNRLAANVTQLWFTCLACSRCWTPSSAEQTKTINQLPVNISYFLMKITVFQNKENVRVAIIMYLQILLMYSLMKRAEFSHICCCTLCYDTLFYLKLMNKVWPHTDMYLEKGRVF